MNKSLYNLLTNIIASRIKAKFKGRELKGVPLDEVQIEIYNILDELEKKKDLIEKGDPIKIKFLERKEDTITFICEELNG